MYKFAFQSVVIACICFYLDAKITGIYLSLLYFLWRINFHQEK